MKRMVWLIVGAVLVVAGIAAVVVGVASRPKADESWKEKG